MKKIFVGKKIIFGLKYQINSTENPDYLIKWPIMKIILESMNRTLLTEEITFPLILYGNFSKNYLFI